MKRFIVLLLVFALLVPMFSITAFAAPVDNTFSLSRILDGVGGLFRSLASSLTRGIQFVGDFLTRIFYALAEMVAKLLDGLKRLFVPHSDYFPRMQAKFRSALATKFGGINYAASYLKTAFNRMAVKSDLNTLLVLRFPQGHFLGGTSLDLIGFIKPIIPWVKGITTSLLCLITMSFVYRRTQGMIDT